MTTTTTAADTLRELFPEGSTVYVVQRHVSQSGMMRRLSVFAIADNDLRNVTHMVSKVTHYNEAARSEGLVVRGCGMDMHFAVVYDLSSVLYGNGYALHKATV